MADLLAYSSSSPDDQAMVIATWLVGLSDDDRDYVLGLIKTSCDYLRRGR
jgi:hypothetical protein